SPLPPGTLSDAFPRQPTLLFGDVADETDWKVIVIDKEDRWAPELNDVEDVERLLPGVVSAIREWFRT
ncbi:unnamed protein product, partial [Scytosiphon promiscuus]